MIYLKKQLNILTLMTLIALALIFAWVLELGFGMEPCSLCLLQRFGLYISLGILFILAAINYIKEVKWVNILFFFVSLIGIGFSLVAGLRQTYIQLLPADQVPSCGADLNTLLQIVTPFQAIKKVFQGSGECADKAFVFLGLSLANWATILFFALFIIQAIILIRKIRK